MSDDFHVAKGQLTFDEEGQEGGAYHSRVIHWPGGVSGVTLGRGFDMKERKSGDIVKYLTNAGIEKAKAETFSKAAGLHGADAKKFVDEKRDSLGEITPGQQKKLFEAVYQDYEDDVVRICSKDDVVKKYGKTDWPKLNPKIKDVLIDLRYRGDYSPAVREFLQKTIVDNNMANFKKEICNNDRWKNVPEKRRDARKKFLN